MVDSRQARRIGGAVVLALVGWFTLSGCSSSAGRAGSASTGTRPVTVVSVIDGDTVVLDFGGVARERVRLLGIDTPETVHPTLPRQCFGPEASSALHDLLAPGTEVEPWRDVQARDHYGRLLLYLYRSSDGLFVNQWLVEQGLADTSFYEPNTALAPQLSEARRQARADGRGLWSACDGPDQPID